jgi:hypothetical protein
VIKGDQINIYQNADVHDAIVGVDRKHFGRRSHENASFARMRADKLAPLHGDLDVQPDRSSLVAEDRTAKRPPRGQFERSVVATRAPRPDAAPPLEASRDSKPKRQHGDAAGAAADAPDAAPPTRVVSPPREGTHIETAKRPPFGTQSDSERRIPRPAPRFEKSEREQDAAMRSESERARPPEPPRATETGAPAATQRDVQPRVRSHAETSAPPRPEAHAPLSGTSQPERSPGNEAPGSNRATRGVPAAPERTHASGRSEQAASPPRELPGEPANRVYRQHEAPPAAVSNEGERAARTQSNGRNHGGHERQGAQPDSAGDPGANERGSSDRR